MSNDCLVRLCQIDFERDFAFLVVVPGEKEHIIGEARLNRLSEFASAALSFVIADQWQGKSIVEPAYGFLPGGWSKRSG